MRKGTLNDVRIAGKTTQGILSVNDLVMLKTRRSDTHPKKIPRTFAVVGKLNPIA
jgi:hypothetical protein